jgi:hypothetical protein
MVSSPVVTDGKGFFVGPTLGGMVMSYDGWQFKLEIYSAIEKPAVVSLSLPGYRSLTTKTKEK